MPSPRHRGRSMMTRGPAGVGPVPWESALLTRRRPVDFCFVAAALCPPAPRRDRVG